jgi:tetratricopeptide (TPR) repeat protein
MADADRSSSGTPTARIAALIVFGVALLALPALAPAGRAPAREADLQAVAAANALVEAGHYPEAISLYEAALARGLESADLYYNLGNATTHAGDLNRAVLYFELAAELDPRDPDIRSALAAGRAALGLSGSSPVESPLHWLGDRSARWLSLDQLALLALALWLLTWLVGLLGLAGRRRAFRLALAVLIPFLAAAALALAGRLIA